MYNFLGNTFPRSCFHLANHHKFQHGSFVINNASNSLKGQDSHYAHYSTLLNP